MQFKLFVLEETMNLPKKVTLNKIMSLIRHVYAYPEARANQLCDMLQIHRATFYRAIQTAKEELGVVIELEKRGYKVKDWGLLNREKVIN
jgi:hypothetical protein